ncbi:hypothetical protein QVD17_06622 [Tagetes erecta]|uniref:Uncharacterized protein n=1 Tax=Tagetes erecta TaxID=13708 RepID=A0AAD8PCD1_TARER|nr:hypothetical protein QVD17_06622 [Tagetes erecta]
MIKNPCPSRFSVDEPIPETELGKDLTADDVVIEDGPNNAPAAAAAKHPHYFVTIQPDGSFLLVDSQQVLVFMIISADSWAHRHLGMYDKDHQPLLTLQEVIMTLHGNWIALSPTTKETLYSVSKNHMTKDKVDLVVRLGNNNSAIDYTVKGKMSNNAFAIYEGQSAKVLATVFPDQADASKDNFVVKLDPGKKDDENFMKIVFSVAGIVEALKTPSKMKVCADMFLKGAAKIASVGIGVGSCFVGPN